VSSNKVLIILLGFEYNLNFLDTASKNSQVTNFIKFHPVGDIFHLDRHDRHVPVGQTQQT